MTAQAAWERDVNTVTASWIAGLDRGEASRLISQGVAARRVLGRHSPEDQPARVSDDHFDTSAFERGLAARRARVRRAAA